MQRSRNMYQIRTETYVWATCEDLTIALYILKTISEDDNNPDLYILYTESGKKVTQMEIDKSNS